MRRGGEDVYETSTHKRHVIPMVRIQKEADWKAWRSGLSVAAKFVGLPHVLMSIPVDRGNQDQVKSKPAAPKLKKKKKKPIPAKKIGRAVATPMKQAVKKEPKEQEIKVEIPEPQFERMEFWTAQLKKKRLKSWPIMIIRFS